MRYLLFLWCLTASAAELSHEQAAASYAIAYGNAGYIPPVAPEIHLTNRTAMCRMVGWGDACPIRGLTTQTGVVYLDETLDFSDHKDASVLVHELVHYVDWSKNGPTKDCQDWLRRETRAYSIQGKAIEKVGGDPTAVYMALRMLRCE